MRASTNNMQEFKAYVRENSPLLSQATHVLFTADNDDGSMGTANLDNVCDPSEVNGASVAIVENDDEPNDRLLVHELSHIIGMDHGYSEPWTSIVPQYYCQLSPEQYSNNAPWYFLRTMGGVQDDYVWSICNRCDLLISYQTKMLKDGKHCMLEMNEGKGRIQETSSQIIRHKEI